MTLEVERAPITGPDDLFHRLIVGIGPRRGANHGAFAELHVGDVNTAGGHDGETDERRATSPWHRTNAGQAPPEYPRLRQRRA
jgi:hypothetical protein